MVYCLGRIPKKMRSAEEEYKIRRDALQAARTKARIEDEERWEELRRKRRDGDDDSRKVQGEEEVTVQRVAPEKEFVATYFLSERTPEMKARRLRYKFNVPEKEDEVEVTLEMFQRSKRRRVEQCLGEAGDLYLVNLHLPCGGKMAINIIAESRESTMKPRSDLFYSCFDIGHCEKAFTVPMEAWQSYLLWWKNVEGIRNELDLRLLFIAIVNLDFIGRRVKIDEFRHATLNDIVLLMNSMMPGQTYERPNAEEALLTNREEPGIELLRMGKIAKVNLDNRFKYLGLSKKGKKQPVSKPMVEMFIDDLNKSPISPRTSPLGPSPLSRGPRFQSTNLHFHFDHIPKLPMAAGQIILNCLDYNSEENLQMRKLNEDVREFVSRDPRKPRKSASTLKSWSDDGWKSTSAESSNTSRNPSEAEAMGPDQDDDEDLNVAVNEGDNDPPALANISLVSGLELLAVTNESQDNSTLEEHASQGAAVAPPQVAAAMAPTIVPGGAEEDGEEWGQAYLLNDSIDLYMVSRPTGEVNIFNISSEDSVTSCAIEEALKTPNESPTGASSYDGKREEDAYVNGFNLKRFK